jgi:hypothetical protein
LDWRILGRYGFYFEQLDRRLQHRFHRLVAEHAHSVNPAVTSLSALSSTALPMSSTRAMSRFLHHPDLPLPALIEPAQDAVRQVLAGPTPSIALVVHDWCMFNFPTHTSKKDRYQRSHATDLGYELGTAFVVDGTTGCPLGPMEFRLRTADGLLSTRVEPTTYPPGHVDELLEAMIAATRWSLPATLVHVIDREADSVGHYRQWDAAGHHFVVRADAARCVLWRDQEVLLPTVVAHLQQAMTDVNDHHGQLLVVTTRAGVGRVRVAETSVVLHRRARHYVGDKQVAVPGPPLTLRLVVTQVVDAKGTVVAEWLLLTNLPATIRATTVGQWYAWRWRIETYHKLVKSAGLNAEAWEQETGLAFLRRLIVGSMACLVVWQLLRDPSDEAQRLRDVLIRLSGRQMKHRVSATAPALLAGLEKLLALDDLLQRDDVAAIRQLARTLLPNLFRSG